MKVARQIKENDIISARNQLDSEIAKVRLLIKPMRGNLVSIKSQITDRSDKMRINGNRRVRVMRLLHTTETGNRKLEKELETISRRGEKLAQECLELMDQKEKVEMKVWERELEIARLERMKEDLVLGR